jgi:hypothetical protein
MIIEPETNVADCTKLSLHSTIIKIVITKIIECFLKIIIVAGIEYYQTAQSPCSSKYK